MELRQGVTSLGPDGEAGWELASGRPVAPDDRGASTTYPILPNFWLNLPSRPHA
jgi:hypothetical protein